MSTSRREKPTPPKWGWQDNAACRDVGLDLFFGSEGERSAERDRREQVALTFCAGCPVADVCREHAMAVPEAYGVWGGLSEGERGAERAAERRRQRETAA
jgi:WhiB family redox-sensing transcriptional regulator